MNDISPDTRPRRRTRRLVDALGRWSASGVIVGVAVGLLVSGGLYDGLLVLVGGLVGMVIGASAFAFARSLRNRG